MKSLYHRVILDGALEGAQPRQLWLSHIRKNWWIYLAGIVCVVGTNVAEVAIPKFIQWILDALTEGDQARAMRVLTWIVATFLVQAFCRIFWRVTLAQQTHYVAARMKSKLWNHFRFFPRGRLESDLNAGELMNIATGDVGTARMVFGFTIVGTTDFIFLLTLTIAAMLSVNVELTLWSLIVLPFLPPLVDRIARRENSQYREAQDSLSRLTDMAAQSVSTARLQRITRTGPYWTRKLTETASDYRDRRYRVQKTALAYIPITGFAPLISYAILVGLGLKKALAGEMTVGAFVAMQAYIFVIQGPLFELGVILSEWQRCFASLDRIVNVFRQPEGEGLRSGGIEVRVEAGMPAIEAHGLSFSYGDRAVVTKMDLQVRQGERVGVKGPIGSGKSTLLHVLAGFERNFDGTVHLFGKDVRGYSHASLRSAIRLVPQKPFLFADTVRRNVLLDRSLPDEEVWRLLEMAGLVEDVRGFPNGLDTYLGEWGVNLSGGQKQRLTLARALGSDPSILMLDDCLSAVDTVTEEKILRNLDRELTGKTLIWVAHRDSTLRYCGRVIDLGRPHGHPLREGAPA